MCSDNSIYRSYEHPGTLSGLDYIGWACKACKFENFHLPSNTVRIVVVLGASEFVMLASIGRVSELEVPDEICPLLYGLKFWAPEGRPLRRTMGL